VRAARIVVGLAVSAVFAAATLSRVDLGSMAHALGRAAPLGVALGILFSLLEIGVRAWRWRFLLSPLGKVSYRHAFAYTCVGYFSNTLLPMRLGDVARAYLAASALRLPRMATLGSIVTERLADGLTILVVAAGLGLLVTGALGAGPVTLWVVLALLALLGGGLSLLAAKRPELVARLIPARVRLLISQLIQGTRAVRSPRGFCITVGSTLVAYCFSVSVVVAVATAVGISISWPQAAFVAAWIALSTAIPAAPGSVGTYEFVGVSALMLVNQDSALALAAVVLIHAIGTLTGALIGLVMTWVLHLRVWRLADGTLPGPESAAQSGSAAGAAATRPSGAGAGE
jgi:uncharacterized protein (TIRG00374 family)